MSGRRYGRLLVIKESGRSNGGKVKWECLCDCGNVIVVKGCNLRSGNTKSCSCYNKDLNRARLTTHGLSGTKDYEKAIELREFGITLEDYKVLEKKQNYRCKICGLSKKQNKQDLSVDHCHDTGKVRGLLCKHCNFGLGHFRDNVDNLYKAIDYLDISSREAYDIQNKR